MEHILCVWRDGIYEEIRFVVRSLLRGSFAALALAMTCRAEWACRDRAALRTCIRKPRALCCLGRWRAMPTDQRTLPDGRIVPNRFHLKRYAEFALEDPDGPISLACAEFAREPLTLGRAAQFILIAAPCGRIEALEWLLAKMGEAGLDPAELTRHAMGLAIRFGHLDVAEYLRAAWPPLVLTELNGIEAADIKRALEAGHLACVRFAHEQLEVPLRHVGFLDAAFSSNKVDVFCYIANRGKLTTALYIGYALYADAEAILRYLKTTRGEIIFDATTVNAAIDYGAARCFRYLVDEFHLPVPPDALDVALRYDTRLKKIDPSLVPKSMALVPEIFSRAPLLQWPSDALETLVHAGAPDDLIRYAHDNGAQPLIILDLKTSESGERQRVILPMPLEQMLTMAADARRFLHPWNMRVKEEDLDLSDSD
jgi:hypothetical protein